MLLNSVHRTTDSIYESYSFLLSLMHQNCMDVWMLRCTRPLNSNVQFYVDGKQITFVTQYTHLGHVISLNMNDRYDILSKRNSVGGKMNNNLVCNFWKCDPFVKLKLLRQLHVALSSSMSATVRISQRYVGLRPAVQILQ